MVFPFAIGAVVDGVPITFHTPLSGHFSPVLAVVPIGFFVAFIIIRIPGIYPSRGSGYKNRLTAPLQ